MGILALICYINREKEKSVEKNFPKFQESVDRGDVVCKI
jgi:hypothetical protein